MQVTGLLAPVRTHSVSTSQSPWSSLPPMHTHAQGESHSSRMYPKVVKSQNSGARLLDLGPTYELAI